MDRAVAGELTGTFVHRFDFDQIWSSVWCGVTTCDQLDGQKMFLVSYMDLFSMNCHTCGTKSSEHSQYFVLVSKH